ncbi:MAG: DUF2914 domain-containing protein [Pseudomonadota bacterium]
MSSASQEEEQHSVQEFAEQYVESLVPREDRYDTRLGDDFYVCTFPNGLKTWLFVYEVEGYRRRRTLGTYPEMSLTDAREALFSARKLQQAEDDLIARGLTEAVLRGGGSEDGERRDRVVVTPSAPSQQPSLAVRAARTLGTGAAGAALAIGGMFAYATLTTQHAPPPPVVSRPAAVGNAATNPVANAQTSAPPTETSTPSASDTENSAALETPPAAAAPPSAEQLALEAALMAVSREMLASNVIDGEPQAELPDTIELLANETRQIYYFTEVRNMVGRRLTHRWRHERREVASFALAEPNEYECPLHSSMLLNTASAGDWRIELLDDAGNVLDFHLFEVVVADGAGGSSGQ